MLDHDLSACLGPPPEGGVSPRKMMHPQHENSAQGKKHQISECLLSSEEGAFGATREAASEKRDVERTNLDRETLCRSWRCLAQQQRCSFKENPVKSSGWAACL